MKRLQKFVFLLTAICQVIFLPKAYPQDFNYKVNAMYVYYFTKYINWPENSSGENIVIGVIGNSDIISELETITANKKSNGHSIIVKQIDISEAKKCQVVIVPKSQSSLLSQLQEATKNLPILIVTEKQGQTAKGAGICIYVDDEDNFKTKFELSKGYMLTRGLKVSHELMALAEVVK